MLNKVILIGRTTKDIELRRTNSGTAVVSFTLAVENRFVLKDGKPTADFINCVAWSNTAEIMEKYVYKGMLIATEGRIQNRNYENKEGNKVYITEVVCDNIKMLEFKNAGENRNSTSNLESYEPTYLKDQNNEVDSKEETNNEEFDISDDELPF